MMKILGIETSCMTGSIALLEDGSLLAEKNLAKGMIHGKFLIPVLQKVLKQIGWRKKDIELIVVDIGPGSYTGLRVGLTTAKTLAYALSIYIIGISSLDAMVQNVQDTRHKYNYICPVIDAKWNQVYAAIYEFNNGIKCTVKPCIKQDLVARRSRSKLRDCFATARNDTSCQLNPVVRITDYLAIRPEELVRRLPRNLPDGEAGLSAGQAGVLVFGDGLNRYKEVFKSRLGGVRFGPKRIWTPRASAIARLGLEAFKQGKRPASGERMLPLYLRPTEAEMKTSAGGGSASG